MNRSELLQQLDQKFQGPGQELDSFLHGLLHRRPVRYWDYIRLDTLLSLQQPETDFPDEEVFILYHQITELYFKLVRHEIRQIVEKEGLEPVFFAEKLGRVNRCFENLVHSFRIMTEGMEVAQYLEFRMALIPASGFQSAQYRRIELSATPMGNLLIHSLRDKMKDVSREDQYDYLYWQMAGKNRKTGEKTATLRQFEEKYKSALLKFAGEMEGKTIYERYLSLSEKDQKQPELVRALREMDAYVNVHWPKVHMEVARKYLKNPKGAVKEATGGSEWRKYLHPKYQKRIFFPAVWSEEEKENWGKELPKLFCQMVGTK